VAIANALQLEAARATPALPRFNYDAMPSVKSLNLSVAVGLLAFLLLIHYFTLWPWTLTLWPWLWPLTLNVCSVSPVTWWNSVPNLNAIEQSAAELLRF